MFSYIPHELNLIQALLSHRTEFMNVLFIVANHLDTGILYLLAATIIFTCLPLRLGKQYLLLLALIVSCNYGLKHLLLQPRPFVLDPSLGLVKSNSLYGLPSGAAQAATASAVFFTHYFKQRWVFISSICYVIFICISRVYIGMHFISDVIAGCLIGFVMTKILLWAINRKSKTLSVRQNHILFCISLALLTVAIYFPLEASYQMGIGLFSGIVFSQIFFNQTQNFIPNKSVTLSVGLGLFGLLLLCKSIWSLPIAPTLVIYLLILTWLTLKGSKAKELCRLAA